MRIFHLVNENGTVLFSNITDEYYKTYQKCNSSNEIIETNVKKFRHGIISEDGMKFYFLTDEKIKSSRLFKELRYVHFSTLKIFLDYRREVIDQATQQANRILHNIVSYNAHTLQSIYSLIPQDQFTNLKTKHLKEIQNFLQEDTKKVAVTLLTILKNNNLMKAELSVFRKLYDQNPELNLLDHQIHKIVKLVINTYWLDFLEKEVNIKISSCFEQVNIDYESFLAAFVHVIENAYKYSLPKTDIDIDFKKNGDKLILTIDMISLKITDRDYEKIYEEGYSGEYPVSLKKDGKGIGMYMVKRLLDINNLNFRIERNVNPSRSKQPKGIPYENNQMIFTLPLSK